MGRRLLGHTTIYGFGAVLGILLAVVQLALLTRLLPLADFGRLAILIILAGFVTLACNLCVVQGSIASVFAGGDGDEEDPEERPEQPPGDNRGVLGTGLLLTFVITAALSGLAYLLSPSLAPGLLGSGTPPVALAIATAMGGLGSSYRLVSAIPRLERRPSLYVLMQVTHRLAALAGSVGLVAAGYGLLGAIGGMAAGYVVTLAAGIALNRHRFRCVLRGEYAMRVFRRGAPFAGIALAFFVSRNVDLFVLASFAPLQDVALYRVAARIGFLPTFAVSAALLAWGPLLRGPMRAALEKQNVLDTARSRLVTYFVLLATWILLGATLFAELLVRVAAREYADAARIIPLLAVAACFHGLLTVTFRMTRIEHRLRRFRRIAVASAFGMTVLSLALVPAYGVYGAAAASIAVSVLGSAAMLTISQRGSQPLLLEGRRLLGAVALAAALILAGRLAMGLDPVATLIVQASCFAAYPLLVVVTGVLPWSQAAALLRLAGGLSRPFVDRREIRARLPELDPDELRLLEALARRGERPAAVAERLEQPASEVIMRFVGALRRLAGVGEPSPIDERLGRVLLSSAPRTQQDNASYLLSLAKDAPPMEVDRLMVVMGHLRRTRPRVWETARAAAEVRREVEADIAETAAAP